MMSFKLAKRRCFSAEITYESEGVPFDQTNILLITSRTVPKKP